MCNAFRVLIGCFVFFHSTVFAQELSTVYSVDQGLPQSTVTSIYRDNEAFLWVGTGDGLGVFDGFSFRRFRQGTGGKNALLNSTIRGITPSTDNRTIWVGSEGGIHQFDRFSLKILHSYDQFHQPGVSQRPVFANDTAVWFLVSNDGLYRIRITDGRLSRVLGIPFIGANTECVDGGTIAFADTSNELVVVNLYGRTHDIIPLPEGLFSSDIGSIRVSPLNHEEFILLSRKGLYVTDLISRTIRPFSLQDPAYDERGKAFASLTVHPDGSWWFAVTGEGLLRYDPVTKRARFCNWQQDGTNMLKVMYSPTSIVCDEYGVLWYGTNGQGLIKCLHGRVRLRAKYNDPLVTDTCNWFVRCFYEFNNGNYLVGTHGRGLLLVDNMSENITTVSSGSLWVGATPLFIEPTARGKLLIGTDRSLLLFDTLTKATIAVNTGAPGDKKYRGSLRLQDGQLLVYGNFGVRVYNEQTTSLSPVPFGGTMMNVSCLYQMKNGNILAAAYYSGLREISPNGDLIRVYDYVKEIGVDSATNVRGIVETNAGDVVLGTNSGLVLLNEKFHAVSTIDVQNGLPDNTVYAVCKLSDSSFVITTGHGVAIWYPARNQFTALHGADGLPSDECNSGALLFSARKWLYVGTTAGFVRWRPEDMEACFHSSRVMVSYTNSYGQAELIRGSLERDYGAGAFDLVVWQSDFAFPQQNIVMYYLKGADNTVVSKTGLHELRFASLASGNYVFCAGASIPGCVAGQIVELFPIVIIPPYWETNWFLGLVVVGSILFITLMIYVFFRIKYLRKLRAMKMQQELDRIRQRISSDIHDEIGAGLTKIALSGDIMALQMSADPVSKEKVKWISGTARELSQNMKEVVWSVNPHYDSLDHMVAYFRSYVSGVAENGDLRLVYIADEKWPDIQVNPEARRNLLLILKESISNAVKYSQATELRLELHWNNNQFSMSISDNGKGFDLQVAEGVNSNGLRNIRQRAEACACLATITSSPQNGTRIVIVGSIEKI